MIPGLYRWFLGGLLPHQVDPDGVSLDRGQLVLPDVTALRLRVHDGAAWLGHAGTADIPRSGSRSSRRCERFPASGTITLDRSLPGGAVNLSRPLVSSFQPGEIGVAPGSRGDGYRGYLERKPDHGLSAI